MDLVEHHIMESIRAEAIEGIYPDRSKRIRSEGNLRLMVMSDEEIGQLARSLAYPDKEAGTLYGELRARIDELKFDSSWIEELNR